MRRGLVRRLALATMFLVTAWSIWAWAQPKVKIVGRPAVQEPRTGGQGARAVEAEHAEHEEPPPINWLEFGKETPPYVAMLINFGILLAGFYLFGKKPIAAALQNRRDTIAKDIEEAQSMKLEAEARAKKYQAKLEKLEDEVRTAREGLVHAGEAERDRIIREAEAKAERMRKDAEFLVEQELKQIRQDLLRDTVEAAVGAAQELLQKRITPADQERLAEDYLADLASKSKGPGGGGTTTRETAS